MNSVGNQINAFLVVLLIAVLASIPACGQGTQTGLPSGRQEVALAQQPDQMTPTPRAGGMPGEEQLLTTAIERVVQAVRPAVVFISVRSLAPGEFLQPLPREGVGSGVIYDPSGLILTNNHVIENAQRIRVVLADGRTFQGQVVGRDPLTDIAVLKIDGENLPTAPLGSSEALRVGQWVVAIGNALGLEGGPTVTEGIVSALDRSIEDPRGPALENLIQTSAAINPGNSGGPLVNLNGEVVGINTAVPGPTARGFQPTGIGFAIAIDSVKPILAELVQQGRVLRPFLGVDTITVTPALATHLELSVREGALVVEVGRDTPAARAGIERGDVIMSLDGRGIPSSPALRRELMARQIGDRVAITVVRDGERRELTATLGERP